MYFLTFLSVSWGVSGQFTALFSRNEFNVFLDLKRPDDAFFLQKFVQGFFDNTRSASSLTEEPHLFLMYLYIFVYQIVKELVSMNTGAIRVLIKGDAKRV